MTRTLRLVRGAVLAALSVVGFATTFVAGGELAHERGVTPVVLAMTRFLIAGGAMLAAGLLMPATRRSLFALRRRDWLRLLWLGPIGTAAMAWFVFMGCARVSVANASMADALTPLGIFAVSAVVTRRATPLQLLGLALGFVGALFTIQVLGPGGLRLSAYGLGDVYILASAIVWGVYTVLGRDDIRRLGPYAFSTWTMLIGAALLLALLAIGELATGGGLVGGLTWPAGMREWCLVLVLGLFCTLLPFLTWNAAQNDLPLSVLAMSAYFTPAVAVLVDWAFSGRTVTVWQVAGTALICASAVVETGRDHNGEK